MKRLEIGDWDAESILRSPQKGHECRIKRSTIQQLKKQSCNVVAITASDNPTGSAEAGMILQRFPKLR